MQALSHRIRREITKSKLRAPKQFANDSEVMYTQIVDNSITHSPNLLERFMHTPLKDGTKVDNRLCET